jgi:16S rRNA (guanine(966)-N(2))-methyltransferase RsmD
MKENLFNLLPFDMRGMNVLDLFSGTGALGIEALSRGARYAVFVDIRSREVIAHNLSLTHFGERASIVAAEYKTALAQLSLKQATFDLIFMDPPYRQGHVPAACGIIAQTSLLSNTGVIAAEQASDEPITEIPGLVILKERRYGITRFVLYNLV